jgi:hypothetical protein
MAIADNLGYVKLGMAAAWRLTDKHTSVPHLNLTEHKGLSP